MIVLKLVVRQCLQIVVKRNMSEVTLDLKLDFSQQYPSQLDIKLYCQRSHWQS